MSKTHSDASSLHSNASSTTSSAAARARAKAEAAKARLYYAEEEINLKLEKAKLEASMQMLEYKKETAAAVAEAEALEAAVDNVNQQRSQMLVLDSTPLTATQRTQQYVAEQTKTLETEHRPNEKDVSLTPHNISQLVQPCKDEYVREPRQVKFERCHSTLPHQFRNQNNQNVASPLSYPMSPNSNFSNSNANEFVRYLARRELVSTGLLQFDDKPQNYRAWKRSFHSATDGLNLTPSEELDLLLKWLGEESKEHAERIRAIHVNNPEAGLDMLWTRLERTYGSTEAIEDALFKRIDAFPKIGNREYAMLTKLSDLLMELLSAKDEGVLPGLSFLDTARGVNPIVHKLPFRLQEKWASVGASYKRRENVHYPPFSLFVDFVQQEASIANDPSFSFITQSDSVPKAEKSTWQTKKNQKISAYKTEIKPKTDPDLTESPTKAVDADKMCPIHGKPHPLHKCRAFRERPIEDRKTFLKENNLCFKCCSSTHIAKNCKVQFQCFECKSERHCTALHPEPTACTEVEVPAPEHGGEEVKTLPESDITTKCTKVCGGDLTDRSCSKICLVKVYPAGHRERAVKVYAILDEQSNRSLTRSQFFDVFADKSLSVPYTLKTCAGVKEVTGRRANGYELESLDGTLRIPLPSLTECNDIPNNRDEIPTPSVALHHAHLKSIAHLIPEMDPNAQIMLLLGRDVIRVHKVRKQVNGSHNQPYAQKLDVGWVVVGNMCLGSIHRPLTISSFYTSTIELRRPSIFNPCPNVFHVKEKYSDIQLTSHLTTCSEEECICDNDHLGCNVFQRTKEDNQVAPSIQDASFMKIMNDGQHKDSNNSWVAPLPFKNPRRRLPNNRPLALKHLMSLEQNIEKPEMRSLSTTEAGFDLLKKTQDVPSRSNLRLHKIAANPKEVMEAFPSKDHASDLKDLNLNTDKMPMQRSLGLNRNLQTDCFVFIVSDVIKPYTRRGVLSTINNLYDPLGFAAPVTLQGKAILRELTAENGNWDAPLPCEMEESWTSWKTSLRELKTLVIPWAYTEPSPLADVHRKLFVFSDALTKTIAAAVANLKIPTNIDHNSVKSYLSDQACSWTFNPPHASHFGGAWERMIRLAKKILNSIFLQLKDQLTHEVLVTFMAEVPAIINSRPLVPTDRDELRSLTPATLLTQKVLPRPAPAGKFGPADLSKRQWRHDQHLSNTFWDRWQKQFLPTLQARKKWRSPCKNIEPKSIVLLKDRQVHRNERPLGMLTKTFSSKDGRVRQVKVNVIKPGGEKLFVRLVTELALLLPPDG